MTRLAAAGVVDARSTPEGMSWTYPTDIQGLDPAWIKQALEQANPGVSVTRVESSRIIWGTATKAFFTIDYIPEGDKPRQESLCFKGAFDERMRTYYDLSVLYTTEAAFYRDIAPQLDMPLPKCWLAIENGNEGIVALEDLGARGVTFVEASEAWPRDRVEKILVSLAELHAKTWGWRPGALPWITLGSGAQRGGLTAMMSGDRFDQLTGRPEIQAFLPKALSDRDIVLDVLQRLWRSDDNSEHLVLCHGDAHLGQTYVEPDGTCGLLDWQSLAIMPWAKDVAYFIGGALTPDDRRAAEQDLLRYYLAALVEAGGPRIDPSEAWIEYRRQMLCGLVWPVVTETMQPMAAIATMSERYLRAIVELDSLALIESD